MPDKPTETRVVVATDDDMMSVTELLLLSAEHRFGRIADSLDKVVNAATAGANNVETLTAQVNRLADAFESIAATLGCMTESVEGQDGVARCYVRTQTTTSGILSYQGDSEGD